MTEDRPLPRVDSRPIEIIAHRGYSGRAPENTLAALREASRAGADALEFDLHVTSDGIPILLHDEMLDRTTNALGPVARVALRELRQLDAGSWYSAGFARERIPTLAEALALAAGEASRGRGVARVYPEIKGYRGPIDIERMAAETREAGWARACTFLSLDWDALEAVREADQELEIGYVAETPEQFLPALDRAVAANEADGWTRALLDCDYRLLLEAPARVAAARERGIDLVVWTVNDPLDALRLVELGVSRFTTDEVEAIGAAVRNR